MHHRPAPVGRLASAAAILLGLAVMVEVTIVAPAPADAATYTIPARATLSMGERGNGHGHGMSQYGALGAATKGLGAAKILSFYYPHTTPATASGHLRVLITADTTPDVVVLARSGLVARSGKTVLHLARSLPRATRFRLVPISGGRTQVDYRTSRWHRLRALPGTAELAAGGAPVTLLLPSGAQVAYRGALRATHGVTVDVVGLEDYLDGVVPTEVPGSWPAAALRAQAVAARTYAAWERAHAVSGSGYDICDTSACQNYGGSSADYPATDAAVKATEHEILTYRGSPAFTQYAASNGGWTSDGAEPYLPAEKDPYDGVSGSSDHARTVSITDATVERAWPSIGNLTRVALGGRDGHGQWGGRVGTVRLTGSKGDVTVTGDAFRSAVGMTSTWFTVEKVTAGR